MQVNDLIRFKYTGSRGKILIDYLDGSFKVLLIADNEDSIAFREDIVLEKDFKGIEKSPIVKNQGVQKLKQLSTEEMFYSSEELEKRKRDSLKQGLPQKKEIGYKEEKPVFKYEEQISEHFIPVFKETAPTDSGVWLAFAEQTGDSYIIYLVNDTMYSLRFEFSLSLNQKMEQNLKQTIAPHAYFPIGEFNYEYLNDSAVIDFSCPGMHLKEQLKLKYKKWVSMTAPVPILGIECRCHLLFNSNQIAKVQQETAKEDLQKYTQGQIKEQAKKEITQRFYNNNDLQRLAHFNNEIDLHAEKLIPNYKNLNSGEIFELQKLALENYMQQAIELGVKEVYLIHGLGEGKLKKAVEEHLRYLKREDQIKEYKNEYIRKYGFGATMVKI
jgi:hypothetical protein